MTSTGYDLGGAKCPIIEEGVTYTVVDLEDPLWDLEEGPPGEFIRQDLREDFSHLPSVPNIWIGGCLRYLTHEQGYLSSLELGYERQIQFAERLDKILESGGRVTIRDHLEVISYILTDLIRRGYEITFFELNNPYDLDMPSDWVVELRKPQPRGEGGIEMDWLLPALAVLLVYTVAALYLAHQLPF
jgi:hypothetical protein